MGGLVKINLSTNPKANVILNRM